jgi:lipopolysaccharide transport system ATP-binding protein
MTDERKRFLSVRNLGLAYDLSSSLFKKDYFWALRDVSFDLYEGESLGVIGRNGVGKSTLLRMLAGIMEPDEGTVERNVDRISLLSLQIGLTPHLSGRENAIMNGMLMGMRRAEIEGTLEKIYEFSELGEFFDRPVSTYSTGMSARLGFAVTMQLDPEVMLIDEVTAVGDEVFRAKSFAALEERISGGKSLILVSHAPNVIRQLCSRVVWIEHGEVVQEGDTDEVLDAYHAAMSKQKVEQ